MYKFYLCVKRIVSSVYDRMTSFITQCGGHIATLLNTLSAFVERLINPRIVVACLMCFFFAGHVLAQSTGADYEAGMSALSTVSENIANYIPYVVNLCYAIAGIVVVVGAISVFMAMNNQEQDVKKRIMLTVGSCLFLIAAAQTLPLFFGL